MTTGKIDSFRYLVKAENHYFFLMHFDIITEIYYEPWRNKDERFNIETMKAYNASGEIYKESGPDGVAEKIRDALPKLQKHSRLPAKVRKALQGIQL